MDFKTVAPGPTRFFTIASRSMEYATAWRTFNFCIGLSPERPAASSDKNERRVVGDDFTVMAGTAASCLAFWRSTDHRQYTLCVISQSNWEYAYNLKIPVSGK